MRTLFLSLFASAALVVSANSAKAQKRSARVTFSSNEPSCPSAEAFEARFESLVGSSSEEKGRASVFVKKRGERFDVTVRVQSEEARGVRRVSAETCQLAVEAAALIAAISLFPERAEEIQKRAQTADPLDTQPEPSETEQAAKPVTVPRIAENTEASPASTPKAPSELSLLLGLGLSVDAISMPELALGIGGTVGLKIGPSFIVELSGVYFFAQTTERTAQSSATFAQQLLVLRGCYEIAFADTSLAPCLGVKGIRVVGEGEGTDRTHEQTWIYGGPAIAVVARVKLSKALALRVDAQGSLNLARPRFLLEGSEIHRPSLIGFDAFAGPELRF